MLGVDNFLFSFLISSVLWFVKGARCAPYWARRSLSACVVIYYYDDL